MTKNKIKFSFTYSHFLLNQTSQIKENDSMAMVKVNLDFMCLLSL